MHCLSRKDLDSPLKIGYKSPGKQLLREEVAAASSFQRFLYLKHKDRGAETESFCLPVQFPGGHNPRGLDRLTPGVSLGFLREVVSLENCTFPCPKEPKLSSNSHLRLIVG